MSEAVSGFDAEWKKLHVETYEEQEPRLYVEVKNVVVPESLVGVVPGVAVAAFAGDNAVGIKTNPLNKLPQNKTNQKRKKKLLLSRKILCMHPVQMEICSYSLPSGGGHGIIWAS